MSVLIWFNEDGLNPSHQMVQDYPEAPRVYVFDVEYLQQWHISKHRVQFVYESLLEIPQIEIFKGQTVAVLQQLITEYNVSKIVTTETPNHLIKNWQNQMQKIIDLLVYSQYLPVVENTSVPRFARYWKKHQQAWLTLEK